MKKLFGYILLLVAATAILTAPFLLTYKQPKPAISRFTLAKRAQAERKWDGATIVTKEAALVFTNLEVVVIDGNIIPRLSPEEFDALIWLYPTNFQTVEKLTFYRDRNYGRAPMPSDPAIYTPRRP